MRPRTMMYMESPISPRSITVAPAATLISSSKGEMISNDERGVSEKMLTELRLAVRSTDKVMMGSAPHKSNGILRPRIRAK